MKKGWIFALAALGIIALVVCAIGGTLAGTYNTLVKKDQQVEASWAQVENQLKRRADLIPNLVETVKGFAAHETGIIEEISGARAKLAGARTPEEAAEANSALDSALGRLLVIVENYPNLKADRTFIGLMDELSGTENRIAVARQDYNEAVRDFNTTIKSFPTNLIAGVFGFDAAEYFEAPEGDKEAPEVDF